MNLGARYDCNMIDQNISLSITTKLLQTQNQINTNKTKLIRHNQIEKSYIKVIMTNLILHLAITNLILHFANKLK